MLGYLLDDYDPIFVKDKFLMKHVTRLQLDYIHGHELVKFFGQRRIDDGNGGYIKTRYSDDYHGEVYISEVIRVKAFQKIFPLLEYFLKHTRPKLHALRRHSLIFKFLPLIAIKRFSWSNRSFKSSILFVSPPTDATLLSYVKKREQIHKKPRDVMEPAWQWQQFTNPTTQGSWFWREADSEWFNMNPRQFSGDGPAGTWLRYRDPTSFCCFWWRNNEDWGWEQR